MSLSQILNDERFNIFFSFILGVGIICMVRPICKGSDCTISKPPNEQDFDKYVYKMGNNKCFEFKSEIVDCPTSGTIEAFGQCSDSDSFRDQFVRRQTPISRCE